MELNRDGLYCNLSISIAGLMTDDYFVPQNIKKKQSDSNSSHFRQLFHCQNYRITCIQ